MTPQSAAEALEAVSNATKYHSKRYPLPTTLMPDGGGYFIDDAVFDGLVTALPTLRAAVEERDALEKEVGILKATTAQANFEVLSEECIRAQGERDDLRGSLEEWKLDLAALRAENLELREALEPFAGAAVALEKYSHAFRKGDWQQVLLDGKGMMTVITARHLNAARAALARSPEGGE